MIIDTHAHVVPGTMLDALRSETRLFPSVRLHEEGGAPRLAFAGGEPGRPIQPRLHDLAQRRDWLRQARVDHQLVGGWTDVYGYELPGEEAADWARFYNEHMAQGRGGAAGADRARDRAAAERRAGRAGAGGGARCRVSTAR